MKTIDVTPTWESIIPLLVEGLKSNNPETYNNMLSELKKMAKLADLYKSPLKHP